MLARTVNFFDTRRARLVLLLAAVALLPSCATKEPVQLVSDPSTSSDSALPWNRQEKWEGRGQFGPIADRLGGEDTRR